ncbi:MAG TPA: hypothetical protein VFJ13_08045 [Paracoccaceae bacterium]|nr:hypothetical protein [Paracoccaceae bacterium]
MTLHSNPSGPAQMALDLSSTAIRLMQRNEAGGWRELGAAPLDGEFSGRIDALRAAAPVRGRGPVPVDLWLPPEQVVARRYALPQGASGEARALRLLAAETGLRAHDLSIALSPTRPGEPTTVLAVPAQIVHEARAYSERWGFLPGRVSIRPDHETAAAFGEAGPTFGRPPRFPRAFRAARHAAVAAAAILIGATGWGAWGLLEDPPPPVVTAAPVLTLASIDAGAPRFDRAPFTQVQRREVHPLTVQQPHTGAPVAGVVGLPVIGLAPDLLQPTEGVPIHVGPGPVRPGPVRPADLARAGADAGLGDLAALVHSVDRLRTETAPPAAEPPSGTPVTTPNAGVAPTAPAATSAGRGDGGPDEASPGPGSEPAAAMQVATATMAPRSVPAVPTPRPERAPEAETPTAADARAEAEPGPEAESAAKPEADAEPATTAEAKVEVEVDVDAEPAPAEPVSMLAALAAPRPPARPEQKARSFARAAAQPAFGGDPSPANIRQAAIRRGLELDNTSLIGVLDARSGRQALLRTPAGDFLKVARGDTVEGWRVSAIDRDAVRLTRGGRNRTLLLMLR